METEPETQRSFKTIRFDTVKNFIPQFTKVIEEIKISEQRRNLQFLKVPFRIISISGLFLLFAFMLLPIFPQPILMADSQFAKIPSADIAQIQQRGKLIAIIDYNSTDYFIYKGYPMGFQFELLSLFAQSLGVELQVLSAKKTAETHLYLLNDRADIYAGNLPIFWEMGSKIKYSIPFLTTQHVILTKKNKASKHINQLHARYLFALPSLRQNVEHTSILDASHYKLNELVDMLKSGKIKALAIDKNSAIAARNSNPNIKISKELNDTLNLSWTTRADAGDLQSAINSWLYRFKKTKDYKLLLDKYFNNSQTFQYAQNEFFSTGNGKLSIYDRLIKKESKKINWDWRLLASLIYEESKFDNEVTSKVGAKGIMQLMPITYAQFNTAHSTNPKDNLEVGVKLLKWLDQLFCKSVPNPYERLNFILASYNIGFGHIEDARRLTVKHGKNPYRWEDVAYFLKNKSKPEFYRDPVVLHGFCRGSVPVRFVNNVQERYLHYQNFIAEK